MIEAETDGMDYHVKMEAALKRSMQMGADLACFGDIDIEGNRRWSEERCRNAGIEPVFPLWNAGREDNVRELLSLGYECLIKSINNTLLPKSLLGKIIDEQTVSVMKKAGISTAALQTSVGGNQRPGNIVSYLDNIFAPL